MKHEEIQPKSIEHSFRDWEGNAFGLGYGTGEPHTLAALKTFLEACPESGGYDYQLLEAKCGPAVAWLLINRLCRIHIFEYGTSPRYAWLTDTGKRLKEFVGARSVEQLYEIVMGPDDDYDPCYPGTCNHGPEGYVEGRKCINPFW
jgi:hypothetical protein